MLDPPERVAAALDAVVTPVLRRERRIRDDDIEVSERWAVEEPRSSERVAELDLCGITRTVQQHVHPGDRPGLWIELLAVEEDRAGVDLLLAGASQALKEQAARAASRVVD